MLRRILLFIALASLVSAMVVAAGCGEKGGGTTSNGGSIQEGKAQVLLFTTPT